MFSPTLFLLSALQCSMSSYFSFAEAASANVTIDDTYGDPAMRVIPTYSANWNIGQECSGCAVIPDASKAFMGSWHDTTSNYPLKGASHQVTMTFKGMFNCQLFYRQTILLHRQAPRFGSIVFWRIMTRRASQRLPMLPSSWTAPQIQHIPINQTGL